MKELESIYVNSFKKLFAAICFVSLLSLMLDLFLITLNTHESKAFHNYAIINKPIFIPSVHSSFEENEIEKIDTSYDNFVIPEVDLSLSDSIFKMEKIGYTSSPLNVRTSPDINEDNIFKVLPFGTKIEYNEYNDDWNIIVINDSFYYVHSDYVVDNINNHDVNGVKYIDKGAYGDKRKSYMDFKTITSTISNQFKLQRLAVTDKTGIRTVNGRYCIAMGSYYSHDVGQYIDVTLNNGKILKCVVGDCKQDKHTIRNRSAGLDGGVVEFIVSSKQLPLKARQMGDVSYISDEWNSPVVKIRIYNKNVLKYY